MFSSRWVAAATVVAALAVTTGCQGTSIPDSSLPSINNDSPAQTVNQSTSPPTWATGTDTSGDTVKVALSTGAVRLASSVTDEGAQACASELQSLGKPLAVAVPIHVTAIVKSSSPVDVAVDVGSVLAAPDGGTDYTALWGVTYSDIPGECKHSGSDTAVVTWAAARPGVSNEWSAWLVIPTTSAASPLETKLLLAPAVRLGISQGDYSYSRPLGRNVVSCPDGAGGWMNYFAVDPPGALDAGCNSPAGVSGAHDALCRHQYPHGQQKTTSHVTVDDQEFSLFEVCEGFGAPEGLLLTPPMKCAIIAAGAEFVGVRDVRDDVESLCKATDVVDAYQSGNWLGAAAGKACGYFSDIFAVGAGIAAGGAASETGPGAAAVGVGTYKALVASLKIVCGGIFDGGLTSLGAKFEADHETKVALSIVRDGKCLEDDQRHGVKFSAVRCA